MLNLHLARDKVTENLHVTERALLPTFLNRLAAVRLKIEQERLEESLIKEMTRVVPVAESIASADSCLATEFWRPAIKRSFQRLNLAMLALRAWFINPLSVSAAPSMFVSAWKGS
jgi:hypothetical protein